MNQITFEDPASQGTEPRRVTLSSDEVRDAVRLLSRLLGVTESTPVTRVQQTAASYLQRQKLVDCARELVRRRTSRAAHFGASMFGEPGWDILLLLYTEEDRERLAASRVAMAYGTRTTTGLRWLDYLEDQALVVRRQHPTDGRVDLIELTDRGRDALDSYFFETLTRGL